MFEFGLKSWSPAHRGPTSVELVWKPPPAVEVQRYLLWASGQSRELAGSTAGITLAPLSPDTLYALRLEAQLATGQVLQAECQVVTALLPPPPPRLSLIVTDADKASVTMRLEWDVRATGSASVAASILSLLSPYQVEALRLRQPSLGAFEFEATPEQAVAGYAVLVESAHPVVPGGYNVAVSVVARIRHAGLTDAHHIALNDALMVGVRQPSSPFRPG